jgi:hypothetical protein
MDWFRPFDPPGAPYRLFRVSIWYLFPASLLAFLGAWTGTQIFSLIEGKNINWYSLTAFVALALLNAWIMSRVGSIKLDAEGLRIRPKFLSEQLVPWQAIRTVDFKKSVFFPRWVLTALTAAPKGFPEFSETEIVDETYDLPAKLTRERDFLEAVREFAGRNHPLTAALEKRPLHSNANPESPRQVKSNASAVVRNLLEVDKT